MSEVTQAETSCAVVLFDGVCNLCNGWARFVIERDPQGYFRFASLQSEVGEELLLRHGVANDLASLVLIEEGRVYERSDAVLRIARRLTGGWRAAVLLRGIPKTLRDGTYDWVAKNRYRWFGKQDVCGIPSPGIRNRFLA